MKRKVFVLGTLMMVGLAFALAPAVFGVPALVVPFCSISMLYTGTANVLLWICTR